jgi:hypothetical protein
MANEIDLYEDLERAEKMIKMSAKNEDYLMCQSWCKEYFKIVKIIKEQYPELSLGQ